ncbi:sensor histidine kinase [Acuticoccus mangrovi]|uniref:histidine kinase n=1 Tax=Acuticoccus mangrovi TaxID=2796142 RepID=A0A934MK40_9HYPH|nr:ATP-binding protein [Acuticoccus mangrovi]MBJ3775139.1 hypothetical protein [Acuticoccus mangrovi]
MMLRLSLAARLTLIVFSTVMVGWLATISIYYQLRDTADDPAIPTPARLAAIVELIEATPPEERQRVVDALSSSTLSLAFESAPPPPGGEADILARYAPALGDRVATVEERAVPLPRRPFPTPRIVATPNGLEFRIALRTGETLMIRTVSGEVVNGIGLPVGVGAGLLGTFIALIALLVMQREMGPLRRLAAAADALDLSGPPALLSPSRSSAPEITSLISAFNRLQVRLSELMRARMAMIGGISHDVRTFATRLRLRLETLPEGETRDRAIADIVDMVHLLDDALMASRAGAGELSEELLEFDEIVAAEVEDRRATGGRADLTVAPEAKGAMVLGDRLALRRIVANLVDNALKYGGTAHVAVGLSGGDVALIVDDEGPGIPAEMASLLTEPFVRLETSRSRSTGGAGLGLAIVHGLLTAHGGNLAIETAPGGGARFVAHLPRFDINA